MPSDCFPSMMKQDRHVVPGIKPEETDPRSNTREKKKEIDVCVYTYVLGEGMAPTGVRFLVISEFAPFNGMSLKFNSKACLEIRLFGQNSPLMALRSRRKVPIKDGVKRHRDIHCIVCLLCLGQNEPRNPSCCRARSTVLLPSDKSNHCCLVLAPASKMFVRCLI